MSRLQNMKDAVNYDLDNFDISVKLLMKDVEDLLFKTNPESIRIREINNRKDEIDRITKDLKKVKFRLGSIYENVTLMNEMIIEEMENGN